MHIKARRICYSGECVPIVCDWVGKGTEAYNTWAMAGTLNDWRNHDAAQHFDRRDDRGCRDTLCRLVASMHSTGSKKHRTQID